MAEKVTVKDKNKLKAYVVNINERMKLLAKEIISLSSNIDKMMKGDGKTPYWNGEDAVGFFRLAISNLSHDIEVYKAERERLEALGSLYELVNQGYKKWLK